MSQRKIKSEGHKSIRTRTIQTEVIGVLPTPEGVSYVVEKTGFRPCHIVIQRSGDNCATGCAQLRRQSDGIKDCMLPDRLTSVDATGETYYTSGIPHSNNDKDGVRHIPCDECRRVIGH